MPAESPNASQKRCNLRRTAAALGMLFHARDRGCSAASHDVFEVVLTRHGVLLGRYLSASVSPTGRTTWAG